MSGLWWRNAILPHDTLGFVVRGDPQALSKSKYPVVWRYQHTWIIFRVLNKEIPYYRVMFKNEGYVMQYRHKIRTPRFAVRIGFWSTVFYAFGPHGESLGIRQEKSGLNYDQMKREVRKFRGGLAETDAITMI